MYAMFAYERSDLNAVFTEILEYNRNKEYTASMSLDDGWLRLIYAWQAYPNDCITGITTREGGGGLQHQLSGGVLYTRQPGVYPFKSWDVLEIPEAIMPRLQNLFEICQEKLKNMRELDKQFHEEVHNNPEKLRQILIGYVNVVQDCTGKTFLQDCREHRYIESLLNHQRDSH